MRFGSKFSNSSYTINDVTVPTVAQYKDVGVIISSNLSFTAHLNRILSKAYNSLGMIKRAVPSNCGMALKRTLYLTLVRRQVTYCSQVWRPYRVQDTKALERLQRRATKYSRRQKKVNVPFPFRFRSVGVPFLSTVLKRCYNGNLRTVQRSFPFRSVPF